KRDLAVTLGVGICHVGKARPKALVIRPRQRILPLKIDVVAQDDQRALSVLDVDAPGGVGENQSAYASSTKHARRKGNLGRRIAFVQMHSSLHHGNGNVAARSSQLTDHELSGMTNRRRAWKCRNGDISTHCTTGLDIKTSSQTQQKLSPVATARERVHSPQSISDIFPRRDHPTPHHPSKPPRGATHVHRSHGRSKDYHQE